jgi:excisionase family DNA binding protein
METVDLKGFMTVEQVSKRYRIHTQQVYRAIRSGRLKARKVGWTWLIHNEDLPDKWFDKQPAA